MLEPLGDDGVDLGLGCLFEVGCGLDVEGDDEFHDLEEEGDILRAELVLLLEDSIEILVIDEGILDLLEQSRILPGRILNAVFDPPLDDLDDVSRSDLGQVDNGQIHPALDALLQLIDEGNVLGEYDDVDILLDICVVEPFENVIEYPLPADLPRHHFGVFDDQDQLLPPQLLELLVEALQVEDGLVDVDVFGDGGFAEEGAQFAGEVQQKLGVGLVYTAIYRNKMSL
jgi:hypothetical protein